MKHLFFILASLLVTVPSHAEPACDPKSEQKALVVIDMQAHFITRGGAAAQMLNQAKIAQIIKEQTALIKRAKEANIPIVLIEYSGIGPTNPKLKAEVSGYDNARTIEKSSDGMFDSYNNQLKPLVDFFKEKKIGNIIVAGANGGACVDQSIEGALKNRCKVVAYTKAIADFNYEKFIYPYANRYARHSNTGCADCKFTEVSNLGDALKAISEDGSNIEPTRPLRRRKSDTVN